MAALSTVHLTPNSPEILTAEAKPCLCLLQRLIPFLIYSFDTSISTGKNDVTRGKTSLDNLEYLARTATVLSVIYAMSIESSVV